MKTLNEYINESLINEGFKEFIKNVYDVVSGKKRAERKKLEAAEWAKRQEELKDIKDNFFNIVKNGTKKYDVLAIDYKTTDFSSRWWNNYKVGETLTSIVICDDNTLQNAENAYDKSNGEKSAWAYLNGTNDEEKRAQGFKIIFHPIYKDGKLLATSFKETTAEKADLIYLFDVEDIRLNDSKDINEMIDILTNKPRDFYGGTENIVKELKSKK